MLSEMRWLLSALVPADGGRHSQDRLGPAFGPIGKFEAIQVWRPSQ
jgi:hypothetical protein